MIDFDTFSRRAEAIAAAIPREFMAGIQSVDVHRELKRHPNFEEVVTLGECSTSPLSDPTGQEPFRSIIHLYYGSFADLAAADASFDVDEEFKETIEHELQHHLEDRAGIKDLADDDALFETHARFRAGMDVAPGWYRQGERMGESVWAVDLDLFVELPMRRKEWEGVRGRTLKMTVLDQPLEVEIPGDADATEVFTLEGEGLVEEEAEREAEEGSEEAPGWAGDLHLIPLVR